MTYLFDTLLYKPIYNLLVALIDFVPGANLAIAIILLTIIIKTILFPLSKSAVINQIKMKEIQTPMKEIQEKHKDDKQKQTLEMIDLYKKYKLNPFAGIGVMIVTVVVMIALYTTIYRGGLPNINVENLYSFIPYPETVNTTFLGINLLSKNLWLALVVGATNFLLATQIRMSLPAKNKDASTKESFSHDLAKSMSFQMKYVLPIVMTFISYGLGALISMYFITSNLYSFAQQKYLNKKYHDTPTPSPQTTN